MNVDFKNIQLPLLHHCIVKEKKSCSELYYRLASVWVMISILETQSSIQTKSGTIRENDFQIMYLRWWKTEPIQTDLLRCHQECSGDPSEMIDKKNDYCGEWETGRVKEKKKVGGVNSGGRRRWSRWTLVHLVPTDGYTSWGHGLAVSRRDGWEISGEKHVDLNDRPCLPLRASRPDSSRERCDAVKGPKTVEWTGGSLIRPVTRPHRTRKPPTALSFAPKMLSRLRSKPGFMIMSGTKNGCEKKHRTK